MLGDLVLQARGDFDVAPGAGEDGGGDLQRAPGRRGELLMIGPFANPQEEGSMAIFTTREAAEEFVRGDPFVLHGVVRNWYIRDWIEALVPET